MGEKKEKAAHAKKARRRHPSPAPGDGSTSAEGQCVNSVREVLRRNKHGLYDTFLLLGDGKKTINEADLRRSLEEETGALHDCAATIEVEPLMRALGSDTQGRV